MNGLRVGTWTQTRQGSHQFGYDDAWINSPAARVLSLSLPFTPGNTAHKGAVVENYFDNLLPDSEAIRRRLRARFATDSTLAFDLLSAIGRDCVGAVQLLPNKAVPGEVRKVESEPLSDAAVEQLLSSTLAGGRVMGQTEENDFRISIAGAQEKTALLFHKGKWRRPLGTTPTTHILKLPLGLVGGLQADLSDSVENEWLCMQLLQALGFEVPHCEIACFGRYTVLAVERFDRAWQEKSESASGGWIARLPQEDFCQALGLPSSLKYESDGGPGMRDILRVLDTGANAPADKAAFVKAQIVFWLLAATDGHAKNFSLFHERGGSYRLTPFYDVLSAWPIIGRGKALLDPRKAKLAMAVRAKNPHWKLTEILPRHWDTVARLAGLGDASRLIAELVAQAPGAIATVNRHLPPKFPARVSDRIFAGLQAGLRQF
jgi:serine/threonine-protein kinase HipA